MNRLIHTTGVGLALLILMGACQQDQTAQTEQANVIEAVFASGHLVSDHEYKVTANTEGYLTESLVEEGAAVTAGMHLFQLSANVQNENLSNARATYADAQRSMSINSPERTQLQLQIEQARLQLDLDRKNYERYQKLLASGAVSQLDVDKMKLQFENAERNLAIQEKALEDLVSNLELNLKNAATQLAIQEEYQSDYFLSSAMAGEVLQVYKQPGDLVRRGEVIALIGGGEKLAQLYIAEEDMLRIAEQQEVIISLNTHQQQTFKAVITKVYPAFDQTEQSFLAEARFTEPVEGLYNYTQLQANIIVDTHNEVTVAPTSFVDQEGRVLLANGEEKTVKTGLRTNEWVEVEGIQPGNQLKKIPSP